MDITFDNRLGILLYDGGLLLGRLSVQAYRDDRHLLTAPHKERKVKGNLASGAYRLDQGQELELSLHTERIREDAVSINISILNSGSADLAFDRLDAPLLRLDSGSFPPSQEIWSMQGAAVGWGQDFAFPLNTGFSRDNFLGHLQDAEGGGIPVVYFWNRNHGLALMHIEKEPKEWFMPVASTDRGVQASLELRQPILLQPGERFTGIETVISLHHGDFFEPLELYRELMADRGIQAPEPLPADYDPAWCSWGYEFDVTPAEVVGVLPVLKDLHIRWVTLDDRWFDYYGDWDPRSDTFPGGAQDMKHMVDEIHRQGFLAQVWWYPLCAEDRHGGWDDQPHRIAPLLQTHPDWVILNPDGTVARNNRHLAILCPALPEVREHTAALTRKFIERWGFDGHKLDNIYTVPPCYNPAHNHTYPEQSSEAMDNAYQLIFDLTRQLRPDSTTQICPCGTPLSFQLIPCTDQTVTADPTSSQQVRQRIKFYKALMGPTAPVFADHVELSDGGIDFPSGIGTGGVVGTKFIYPDDPSVKTRLQEVWSYPPEKQVVWKKWFDLYDRLRLSEGEYCNLYDTAFDRPEAHAIRKEGRMYYAFFADEYDGDLELRGLETGDYRIFDYANNLSLGLVSGAHPILHTSFRQSLLLFAEPALKS